jgi:membrane associated rhomboid family serine protease
MTGILEVAVGIGVANAAHLSGLVAGLLIGLVFALKRWQSSKNSEQ